MKDDLHPVLYLPEKDEVYRLLPDMVETEFPDHIILCRGKLFFVPEYISRSQCYVPDLNRWFPAPWTIHSNPILQPVRFAPPFLRSVLVVKKEVCFIVDNMYKNLTWLSKYEFGNDLMVPSIQWLNKAKFMFALWLYIGVYSR